MRNPIPRLGMRYCEPYEVLLGGHEWYIAMYIMYLLKLNETEKKHPGREGSLDLEVLGQDILSDHIEMTRSVMSRVSTVMAEDG